MLSDIKLDKINWNLERLQESLEIKDNYIHNLEKLFYTYFNAEEIVIGADLEGEPVVTLHLKEVTEIDMQELNRIAELYTIEPHNKEVFLIHIFQFRKSKKWEE